MSLFLVLRLGVAFYTFFRGGLEDFHERRVHDGTWRLPVVIGLFAAFGEAVFTGGASLPLWVQSAGLGALIGLVLYYGRLAGGADGKAVISMGFLLGNPMGLFHWFAATILISLALAIWIWNKRGRAEANKVPFVLAGFFAVPFGFI